MIPFQFNRMIARACQILCPLLLSERPYFNLMLLFVAPLTTLIFLKSFNFRSALLFFNLIFDYSKFTTKHW